MGRVKTTRWPQNLESHFLLEIASFDLQESNETGIFHRIVLKPLL